ncbi:leucyl aminopeptidase family protein [Sphingosinicella rhizophila]|uniref:Leucyl aminopeptidase family protein n=1 Tax=Sphingosinicella rhizophila TaxID=3050082 RepID=A0ABU3Q349_9SPHN|nr:leucyl aminopeptidase family protein [Sphingosinicella sp. GR2756]MDT9597833.1 leucyl aminopeptidase family protein [Sphingosinicella sp. GR2756]
MKADLKTLLQPDKEQPATLLQLVDKNGFDGWLAAQPERIREAVNAQSFRGDGYQMAILPGEKADWSAVLGVANVDALSPWCLAKAAEVLPEGLYRVEGRGPGPAALGWLLAQYGFDRFKANPAPKGPRTLLTPEPAQIDETLLLAEAITLVRDLVNLPANHMGPADLEAVARSLAADCGAAVTVTSGRDLEKAFPLIAAVGAAATTDRSPRLIELEWGNPAHPRIALVGKGVCFDSGGLDIKNSAGMRLMKKDMGGAAHVLGLARLVMKTRLPVRLHLLVPAVENAVSGAALRPGDVVKSRKGITVEIGNTDAEGRLVLADALAKAVEDKAELILDFATLTGAARIALGPDLPALFANEDGLAEALAEAGKALSDPLWPMPLWTDYADMLASDIADIGNAAEGGMAGSITAALFLQKFVPENILWAHFDTFAWRASARPGRPKGGDALGLRAAWRLLSDRYALSD